MSAIADPLANMDLPEEARELVRTSITNYQRHARVLLRIDTVNDRVVWCTAQQYELPEGGMALAEAELQLRATEAFRPLQEAGYEPIICVHGYGQGTPEKPTGKYRMAGGLMVLGQECIVVRQQRPRMVFAVTDDDWRIVSTEQPLPVERHRLYTVRARAYWRRDSFRS